MRPSPSVLAALAALVVLAPRPSRAGDPAPFRLSQDARPLACELELRVDPDAAAHEGIARIDLDLRVPASAIRLHAVDLQPVHARLERGTSTWRGSVTVEDGGTWLVGFGDEIPAGPARLVLAFSGALDSVRSRGIYRVKEPDGRWYAYTFFEPVDARRAFPCFDEPGFKIPWTLSITAPPGQVAVANAAQVAQVNTPHGPRFEFARTPPLPSYLVAFVVGPFDVVESGTAGRHGTPLRFVLPQGRRDELRYAREVTPRVVSLLEDWFGMPYPFGKLDVAVVPRYWGTMEHPGIVAMGQSLTLMKPEEETFLRTRHYANILIHELAHYWFGDYVTMAWWDETWLNEGLGTWMDIKITEALEPSWRYGTRRVSSRHWAMSADELVSAKALRQPVESPTDIDDAFDGALTYSKGAAIMFMFERWVGEEAFQRGIRRYMAAHARGNAVTEDLLAALSQEAGRDLAPAMRSFIDQPGVPEVSVELLCGEDPPALQLSQRRYLPLGSAGTAGAALWSVPMCVRYGRGDAEAELCDIFATASTQWALDGVGGCPEWVLANASSAGYYRTAYDGPLRQAIVARMESLAADERRGLVADLGAAVDAGSLDIAELLALVPRLLKDDDPEVVRAGLSVLDRIERDALDEGLLPAYRRAIAGLVGPLAKRLTWIEEPGESNDDHELRQAVMQRVATGAEDSEVLAEARRLALAWISDRSAVGHDMAEPILRAAAWAGDEALFRAILDEARRAKDREDRALLLSSLGGFRDPALAKRALDLMLSGEFDFRDVRGILRGVMSRRETRDVGWAFYTARFDDLSARMRDDEKGSLLAAPRVSCDAARRAEAEAFLTPRARTIDGGPRTLAATLEAMDLCAVRRARNAPGIEAFLRGE